MPIGSIMNIVGGLSGQKAAKKQGKQALELASPFSQYYQQFGSQLSNAANAGQFGQNANAGIVQGVQNYANQTAGAGNPLSGVGQQYANLLSSPSSFLSSPMFQAALQQGTNAASSQLAAQGLNGSGQAAAALQNYGQSFAQNSYNQELSNLSNAFSQSMGANQQAYNQLYSSGQLGMSNNNQQFNQLAQLSGLAFTSPSATLQGINAANQNMAAAGQQFGSGLSGLFGGGGGFGGGLNSLFSSGGSSAASSSGFAGGSLDSLGSTLFLA